MTRVFCTEIDCLCEMNGECIKPNIEVDIRGCHSYEDTRRKGKLRIRSWGYGENRW